MVKRQSLSLSQATEIKHPRCLFFLFQLGILDTLAEEESNSEDEDEIVDIDLVALEAVA